MEEDLGKFSCDQCGKQYKWKPEFAGRKVKCKCGFVMTAPAKAPVAARTVPSHDDGPNLDALYDLAEDGKAAAAAAPAMIRCPHCKNEMEPGLAVCPSCGFNLKTGTRQTKKSASAPAAGLVPGAGGGAALAAPGGPGGTFAAFGSPRRRGEELKIERNDAIIDWFIPIGLLAAGMILGTLRWTTFSATVVPVPHALMYAGLNLVLGFVLMAVASIFMIQWGEIAFGDPAQAAIKIAAAVTAPVFIANIISFLIHDAPPYGWGLVGFFLAFGMFFILYHYLFEWDLSEKWVVVAVTTVVTMLAVPFLFNVIVNGGHLGTASAEPNDDADIGLMDEMGRTKDARAWFDESRNRIIGDFGRADCEKFMDDLYNLGPKQVEVVPAGPQAAEIYVKLPSDAKRRKAIVEFCDQWMKDHKKGGVRDKGGKYLMLIFFSVPHPEPV